MLLQWDDGFAVKESFLIVGFDSFAFTAKPFSYKGDANELIESFAVKESSARQQRFVIEQLRLSCSTAVYFVTIYL